MRVNVIRGSGDDVFRALSYAPPDNGMLNYINNSMGYAKEQLGNIGTNFMDRASNLYNRFNSNEAINRSKQILNQSSVYINEDVVYLINSNNINNSNIEMQQWIMEEPTIRKAFNKQMIEGFSESYFDFEPEVRIPSNRTQFMQVASGITATYMDELDGSKYTYTVEDRKDITDFDRQTILDSWMVARDMLCDDIDPTD